jgi:pimeloyl-ACP methyl ester carboxylesterase
VQTPHLPTELGELTQGIDVYGSFYTYLPANIDDNTDILVLVHGTPKDLSPEENAAYYAASWMEFADEQNLILIAPAFNQDNFSSRYGDHAMSGYRGLFGREIGADEWVKRLVEAHREAYHIKPTQFNIYGHSAGGQFVSRYLVTHPEEIRKAVITSAATYPQPQPEIPWPFGMGELNTEISWDDGTITQIDIHPDKNKWLAATKIPLTVIVGLNDSAELPSDLIPGQKGVNRLEIARNWINDMQGFAESNGVDCNFQVEIIPGIGHSMIGLIAYSQNGFGSN